jgi:hypothetical protein
LIGFNSKCFFVIVFHVVVVFAEVVDVYVVIGLDVLVDVVFVLDDV